MVLLPVLGLLCARGSGQNVDSAIWVQCPASRQCHQSPRLLRRTRPDEYVARNAKNARQTCSKRYLVPGCSLLLQYQQGWLTSLSSSILISVLALDRDPLQTTLCYYTCCLWFHR